MKTMMNNNLRWINIDQVDEKSIEFLKKEYSFHHLDLEDVHGESQAPKLDTYKNYLFLVVQFPHWNPVKNSITTHELNIFLGDGYLITIQHSKSKELKDFFYRCMRNKSVKKNWMSDNSGYLLYQLLESLYKKTQPILSTIGKQLTTIEEEIFEEDPDTETIKELAIHRRNILSIRRIIDPQRYLMASLSNIRKPFLNEQTSLYFDDVSDYLSKIWSLIDTYRETVQGLHVTVESLIDQRTNKVIGALTAVSAILLPFTVLSGIYGMNIAGLPYAHNPIWVWAMFGVLACLVGATLFILRRKGWL